MVCNAVNRVGTFFPRPDPAGTITEQIAVPALTDWRHGCRVVSAPTARYCSADGSPA
jgi:hypothetical protein